MALLDVDTADGQTQGEAAITAVVGAIFLKETHGHKIWESADD